MPGPGGRMAAAGPTGARPGGNGIGGTTIGAGATPAGGSVERRYQLSPAPAASPRNRKYSKAPAEADPARPKAVGAVVAPLAASTTRMPSPRVGASAPPTLATAMAVNPEALAPAPVTTSRSDGAPSAASCACSNSSPFRPI